MAAGTINIIDTSSTSTSGQGGQSLITGTPTAGSVLQYTTPGANGFSIEITGTWTGTLSFEQTVDNGTTWVAIDALIAGINTSLNSVTANGIFKGNCANDSIIRVRATAAMTGAANVSISGGSPVDFSHVNITGSSISPLIGTVDIDQTTPGVTNGVVVNNTGSNPVPVTVVSGTTGGTSTYSAQGGTSNALLTATAVTVKASAGNLFGIDFVNLGASVAFVQIFDALIGSVTLGTTVPKISKWVPAGGAWEEKFCAGGEIAFATGIAVAATTTPTGLTAPGTGINANITYK